MLLCPQVFADSFSDVSGILGTEYIDAINYVSDNHIMVGTSANLFSPDLSVTRGMFVAVLFRMSGDTGVYSCPFTDVRPDSYYYNAIGWAKTNGIASGVSQTLFAPDQFITKQQLTAILYKYAGYLSLPRVIDESINNASDYTNVDSYAVTGLSWAYSYGIFSRSNSSEAIAPTNIIDRKELALIVSRFRTHAEGINFSRDSFAFANSGAHFVSGGTYYLMSEDDWTKYVNTYSDYGGDISLSTIFSKTGEVPVMVWQLQQS